MIDDGGNVLLDPKCLLESGRPLLDVGGQRLPQLRLMRAWNTVNELSHAPLLGHQARSIPSLGSAGAHRGEAGDIRRSRQDFPWIVELSLTPLRHPPRGRLGVVLLATACGSDEGSGSYRPP